MLPNLKASQLFPFSITLMVLTYVLLGWHWRMNAAELQRVWLLGASPIWFWLPPCGIVLLFGAIASGLMGPPPLEHWFDSDWAMFFTVLLGCCLGILMLIHAAIVAELALLFCAMLLLQLDLCAFGLSRWRVCVALWAVALGGMTLGGLTQWSWQTYWPIRL